MANQKKAWALILAAALATASGGFAQVQKGSISVTVVDPSGAALPGVTVAAEAIDSLTRRNAVTDERGLADLVALDPSIKYIVTASLDTASGKTENVVVRSGQNATVRMTLSLAVSESISVTGEAPIVDITNAITGLDVTLELTESLPTGRSYQTYLQLVPGVKPSASGNPSSRSGVNFTDNGGIVGTSTDNAYYVEGIDVTDRFSSTFGANLNTEIIQEQAVLTGGLPAEYAGAPGLVSNVATKSGGNAFSGSLNYFFQDDGLVADDKNTPNAGFSTYDTAFTVGGPVVRDRAWFFASYRLQNNEQDVALPDGTFLRGVTTDQGQAFGKLSWNVSESDLISGLYLTDPFERDGSLLFTTLNNRSLAQDQGGDRYSLNYTRVFSDLVFSLRGSQHENELTQLSADQTARNNVIFRTADGNPSAAEIQLGGAGFKRETNRSNDNLNLAIDWNLDTAAGSHALKLGATLAESEYFENDTFPGQARYESLSTRYLGAGLTAAQLRVPGAFTSTFFNPANTSDRNGLINSINNSANRAALYGILDTNRDGALSTAELGNGIVFNSTAGNPNGQINYYRNLEVSAAPYAVGSTNDVLFAQDSWQMGRWTINAGVRAERSESLDSDGNNLFTFDWDYAPRFSAAWDVFGNGKHRISAYYGRYYDPIRDFIADFSGAFEGPVRHEQVYLNGEFLTYRVRGGRQVIDAAYAPTTKTPYTDEILLGYKVDLGRNMSFEITGIKRETRDIFEDFDLCLYAGECYPGNSNASGSLFLGLDYFGYSASSAPNSNFVLATLPGGKRDYDGVELVFRKRMADNWQMLASYAYGDSRGNSNSDGSADFAGDDLQFDPRSPNLYGKLPGGIDHIFKVAGSYRFDFGLEVGGSYNWNSGTYDTLAVISSARYLPIGVDEEFDFNGTSYAWTDPDAVGAIENDSYGTLDLRTSYVWAVTEAIDVDLFIDMFNVFDDQATILSEAAVGGANGIAFGEGKQFVQPQRFFLGARLRF